jgi:hypothetical protein
MSRAFVKEVEYEINDLPDRPVSTQPNHVTAEGLAAVERTLSRFEAANKAAIAKNDRTAMAATQRELRYWIARRSTAKVVEPTADKSKVQFGATVTVRRDDGRSQTRRPNAEMRTREYLTPVTSYALPGEEKKARAAGCEDYVTKPFSPRQLLAKIRQYLS